MQFQLFNPILKWLALCIIPRRLFCKFLCEQTFQDDTVFMKINTSYSNAFFLFILKYRPVYIWLRLLWKLITMLIFVRFLWNFTCWWMIEYGINIHKISEAYLFLVCGKPFITELIEGPSLFVAAKSDTLTCTTVITFVEVAKWALKIKLQKPRD